MIGSPNGGGGRVCGRRRSGQSPGVATGLDVVVRCRGSLGELRGVFQAFETDGRRSQRLLGSGGIRAARDHAVGGCANGGRLA